MYDIYIYIHTCTYIPRTTHTHTHTHTHTCWHDYIKRCVQCVYIQTNAWWSAYLSRVTQVPHASAHAGFWDIHMPQSPNSNRSPCLSPSPAPCPRSHTRTSPRLGALPHRLTWGRCRHPASAGRQTTTTRCRRSLDKALCSCCHTLITPAPEPQQAHTDCKVWECRAWDRLFLVRQKCPCAQCQPTIMLHVI